MGCGSSAAKAPPSEEQLQLPMNSTPKATTPKSANPSESLTAGEKRGSIFANVRSSVKPEDVSAQQALEPLYVSPDLYGLLVTEPLQLDSTIDGCCITMLVMCRLLFLALCTFATQLLAASRMDGIAMEKEGAQCPSSRLSLQLICVFIISASLMRKMRDTANLAYLLLLAPLKPNGNYTGLKGNPPPIRERRLAFSERVAYLWASRAPSASDESMNWSLDLITTRWKVFSLLCIVLPRVLLAMLIAKAGAYLVVRTDPESAIVDTIATLFLVDFDSFVYTAFTAVSTKQRLATTDPVQVDMPSRHRIISFIGTNTVGPLITLAMTATLVFTMRRSCTGNSTVGNAAVSGSTPSNSTLSDLAGIFTFW